MASTAPVPDGGFHTTHWTVVLRAGEGENAAAQQALETLCASYWYPLYAYIRRQGVTQHEAEDLTQAFFQHVLERKAFARVHPGAGKFRSFLLTCLKNFLVNERDRGATQRRGGGKALLSLDIPDAEARFSLEPADRRTPEHDFERRWAFRVIQAALDELRLEYSGDEKHAFFQELQAFLPGGSGAVSRRELAARRGVSVGAIDVAVHRVRHRFAILLRKQVANTVATEGEVEGEIRHLISVIGGG